ncbi:MAG: DUF6122 family protein [Polaribacter sp.]|uniref:DUF6122 family protein n=1 Tax=Polaribacter sp. TaxID=1920175 RepID=UPI003850A54C
MSLKLILHYGCHFVLPLFISVVFFKRKWKQVFLIFLCSMLVDLDHLLATPIFENSRCSINYHPLHSYTAISCYAIGLFFKKTRILCIALLLHMITDYIDCYL